MDTRRIVPALLALAALAAAPARSSAQAPRTIPVRLTEYHVAVADSVTQGQVVFAVTNAGTVPHSLRIRGHRAQVFTRVLAPGESVNVPMRLVAGEYSLYCAEKTGDLEHRKEGMEHRVQVVW
ncbi:MAG TPA: hypothetical protein VGO40_10635, partial [Longimicrobium sp.]|nr:hypothetical protein [Longimicrobium sp.]